MSLINDVAKLGGQARLERSMMRFLLGLNALLLCSFANASSLSPSMNALCDRAEHSIFVPKNAPRPSSDTFFQLLSKTSDSAVLERAMVGLDLDALRGSSRMPALAFVAASGNVTALRLLIQHGAQVDQPDKDGYPPIVYAMTNGQPGTACILIRSNARIPEPNREAYLLPALAIAEDHLGARTLIEFLIDHGYDINARANGDTALHIAAELGNIPLVKFILSKNANTGLRNNRGETAMEVARRSGQQDVIRLLEATARAGRGNNAEPQTTRE